jgi:regulator of sigma E protease
VFQVAMIFWPRPIAGRIRSRRSIRNKGSYANASLWARISTIFAGPLANYAFASVFFFLAYWSSGIPVETTRVVAMPDRPAIAAGIQTDDRIIEIEGTKIETWQQVSTLINASPDKQIDVVVERAASG